MTNFYGRLQRWLILLFSAITLFGGGIPAAQAQLAEPIPEWVAAATSIDLSVSPAQVRYTVYAGKNGPLPQTATVLKVTEVDISSTCIFHGTFGAIDANGYLPFDGITNYIECDAPGIATKWAALYPNKPLESHLTCDGGAPLFASSDVKLSTGTWSNPIITVPNLGLAYSLPRNANQARSQLYLGSTFTSGAWTPTVAGNQLLAGGWNGPAIIAANARFSWLNYLDPAWKPAFKPIFGTNFRHWYQPPNTLTNMLSPTVYTLGTGSHSVYIGFNPNDSSYFKGSLRKAIFDPGCPIS